MKTKRTICVLVLVAVLIGIGVASFLVWRDLNGVEDMGAPTESIPDPEKVEGLPPITTGPADWPRWRGPEQDGKTTVTGIRKDWSGGLRELWQISYLCQGKTATTWSAPSIQGNRLIVPGRDKHNDMVFCINADTGKLLWHKSYEADADDDHGPGARATPLIANDRIYTFGRSGDLACWKLYDGELLWRRNACDDGGEVPRWGLSSSPLVHEGKVIVQAGGSARVVAYDKMTGDLAWRSMPGGADADAGYAATTTMQVEDTTVLLAFHGRGLAGLDPADGRVLWNAPWKTRWNVHATTPVVDGTTVFISSGYKAGGQAMKVDPTGYEVLWTNEVIASHHSDPIILDGHLYGYSGQSDNNPKGRFKCVELATGKEKWSSDKIGWGTTVFVDGHLLCLSIKGDLFLVKPDPSEFKLITRFPKAMPGVRRQTWTIPVIANGKLYLRYRQRLICYDLINK